MRRLVSIGVMAAACRVDASTSPPELGSPVGRGPAVEGVVVAEPESHAPEVKPSREEPDPSPSSDALPPTQPEAASTPATLTPIASAVERASHHFEEGAHAFQRGDFARAITEFSTADALVPKAAILFNIARSHESLGNLGGARSMYATVLLRPDANDTMLEAVAEAIRRIDGILVHGGAAPK